MNSFRTFRCLTVISEVHMEALHADTQVAVVGSFSFACCHDMFSGNVFRKRNLGNAKPVKHQFFQTSSFWFVWFLGCLVYCDAEAV